jgi:hypothetical protein
MVTLKQWYHPRRSDQETMTKPPVNVLDLPLEVRAEMALRAAVEQAIDEHARQGVPMYVWRDGKVFELSPDELRNISAHNHAL